MNNKSKLEIEQTLKILLQFSIKYAPHHKKELLDLLAKLA